MYFLLGIGGVYGRLSHAGMITIVRRQESLTCRAEAERLIELAKGLLRRPEEEMAILYLDHALSALKILGDEEAPVSLYPPTIDYP